MPDDNPSKKQALKKYRHQYYLDNIEAHRKQRREYYAANRERLKAESRKWAKEHPDRVAERGREYYQLDIVKSKAARREWYKNNPLAVKASRMRRRARLLSAEGSFTAEDVARLLTTQRGKCASCKRGIKKTFTIDHVIPLAKGGSNAANNIQLLCQPCNRRKWIKDPEQWAREIGRLFI